MRYTERQVVIAVEYRGVAKEYVFDKRAAWLHCRKIKDLHRLILGKLAVERDWEYEDLPEEDNELSLFTAPSGHLASCKGGTEQPLENGEVVFAMLYRVRGGKQTYDGVVFHWNAHRSNVVAFVFPVYGGASERMLWDFRDGVLSLHLSDSYADTEAAGFTYTPKIQELKYYLP